MASDKSQTAWQLARSSAREIIAGGERWLVFEQAVSYDRRRSLSLVFESERVVRRVRDFPPNWRSLADEQLLSIGDRR